MLVMRPSPARLPSPPRLLGWLLLCAQAGCAASERFAYNRVDKAGSSTMIELLAKLSRLNSFHLQVGQIFMPSTSVYERALSHVPNHGAYVGHAGFLPSAPKDVKWINVVREPISRWASQYYYYVDARTRLPKLVQKEIDKRKADSTCGCFALEFNDCIRVRAARNCTLIEALSQKAYFCAPRENCSTDEALHNALERYEFIGLTEKLELTFRGLEKLMPSFFKGASSLYTNHTVHRRVTHKHNPLTNTSNTGNISQDVRSLFEQMDHYQEEKRFYDAVQKKFWEKVASLELLS
ncbi:MAG: hypothetical protein SGPRY_007922 [Prymnesium sp.]